VHWVFGAIFFYEVNVMGWNEPPDNNPWGNRGNEPPDIDEVVRKLKKSVTSIFNGGGQSNKNGDDGVSMRPVLLGLGLLLGAWLVYDCFYALDEQQHGVVLRFGKHVADLTPGLSMRFPRPIERVIKVNVGQVRALTHKANMLTQDENIVDVEVAVQWKIRDPAKFLFNLYDPETTLQQVTESAVREVVGKSKLDFVLTEGRGEITRSLEVLIQEVMDLYESGALVAKVDMLPAKPPEAVKEAFDDVIKAREDEQRLVNQAEAYRNDIIPRARGAAARLREEASSYKARVIAKADGEANRFEQLLTEYQRAPEVTRKRIYIDAMESILSSSGKILIDADSANSLMYLPIDKLLPQRKLGLPEDLPEKITTDVMAPGGQLDALKRAGQRMREGR
jgi:membrane protease subunit HflK